jgi:hypothetical protein
MTDFVREGGKHCGCLNLYAHCGEDATMNECPGVYALEEKPGEANILTPVEKARAEGHGQQCDLRWTGHPHTVCTCKPNRAALIELFEKWESTFCDCDGAIDAPFTCWLHEMTGCYPNITTRISVLRSALSRCIREASSFMSCLCPYEHKYESDLEKESTHADE